MSHIDKLVDGFKRFHSHNYEESRALFERLSRQGQAPKTIVVGCCDSRVDPAMVTDCDPGDLFIIRNVANPVPPFETCGNYVENIIVLGHAQCGGIWALLNRKRARSPRKNRHAPASRTILVPLDNLLTFPLGSRSGSRKRNSPCTAGISIWSTENCCATIPAAIFSKRFPEGECGLQSWSLSSCHDRSSPSLSSPRKRG